ncbi:hypothetical protein LZ198_24780 [Myxococcus sp. K15C18031901]|uniref:hypothetical protein n=1 Tax=Myxococcus dinghuensis TaxID=2906761 RepID=UPI0020A71318|nr:hypothetical protein [Myxococcus dinghuensis]MCP3102088.1 hypothetical protein [Myxococcus dinghuensis]
MSAKQTSADSTLTFSEGSGAARKAGPLIWNHLNRLDDSEQVAATLGFGVVGAVASLVTAGVNLWLGGRNMKHNSTDDHSLTLKVNNFTPYTLVTRMLERVENASLKSTIVATGKSVDIELGTRNYAGAANKDQGPSVHFTLTDGSQDVDVEVRFTDTTDSGFSGQVRIRLVRVEPLGCEDQSGAKANTEMKHPFYTYASGSGGPSFMLTASPVSNGHADISLTFMA